MPFVSLGLGIREYELLGFTLVYCFEIIEPCSRHMEDQGLEFLQFAFRWFNCLLIREVNAFVLDIN